MRTALDVHGQLRIRLQQDSGQNDTWVGVIEDPRRGQSDDIGALYYVVAVIFIYGLSIVMMIASHIRKNKQDNQLRTYLKEMASLRKSDRREKVLCKLTDFANRKEVQEVLQAGKKLRQERLKDGDGDGDHEAHERLIKSSEKSTEDNNDSVFLPTELSPPPAGSSSKEAPRQEMCSESSQDNSVTSSGKTPSVSSPTNSVTGPKSPTLSEQRYCDSVAQGKRSPGFHDYRRWKMMEMRSPSLHDIRAFRSCDRASPSCSENRSRSPSLNEFRLSPLCGRERSPSVVESRSFRWSASKASGQPEVRFHTILDPKHPSKPPLPTILDPKHPSKPPLPTILDPKHPSKPPLPTILDPKHPSKSPLPTILDPKHPSKSPLPTILDPKHPSKSPLPTILDPKHPSKPPLPTILDPNHPIKAPLPPASFHVVDEDSVL